VAPKRNKKRKAKERNKRKSAIFLFFKPKNQLDNQEKETQSESKEATVLATGDNGE